MAENIKSLNELDVLFADYVQKILELADDKVLISYSQRRQKSSKIDEDVCYVKTLNVSDEVQMYKNRTKAYNASNEAYTIKQYTMRLLMLQLVFYGPNSEYNATKVNECFYLNSGRDLLSRNNLALVPDRTNMPFMTYERINEQFWQRADLKLYFYNSTCVEEEVGTFKEVDYHIEYGMEGK